MTVLPFDIAADTVAKETPGKTVLVQEYLGFPLSFQLTKSTVTDTFPALQLCCEGNEAADGAKGSQPAEKTGEKGCEQSEKCKDKTVADFKFKGELFLVGGGANKTFYELVKKLPDKAKVVVVALASQDADASESLAKDFEDAGIDPKNITVITDAAAPKQTKYNYSQDLPKNFDMIYFGGGDQAVLKQRFKPVDKLKEALEKGAIVAGNSAGAAIMPCEMITGGGPGDLTHGAGFCLTPWAVTDTHVHSRGREDRDVSALYEIGKGELPVVGLDTDTRVSIRWDGKNVVAEVGGTNSVRVFRKTDQDLKVESKRTVKPTVITGTDGAGKGKSANMWELKAGDKFILR